MTEAVEMERSQGPRANVLGVGISAITMAEAVRETEALLRRGGRGYICVTGVHGIMEAQRDPDLRAILNKAFLTTPDGMPTVWTGRVQGLSIERVYGPDFMMALCEALADKGYRHFLYGGEEGVAEKLKVALEARIPGAQIVGTYTPPFRRLYEAEEAELARMVRNAQPHVMWIGLSTPKQERFMAEYLDKLDVQVMAGVGGAFDLHTGRFKDAPQWVKTIGMQWSHRLAQDPKRLWKRYAVNNPLFVWKLALQALGLRRYLIEDQR